MKPNTRGGLVFFGLAFLLVGLDQAAKYFVRQLTTPLNIFSFLSITYRTNSGALWGILSGHNWLFILLSLLAIGGIVYFFIKEEGKFWPQLFLALILAGVLGNLLDRLLLGYVIDFIEFSFWPTFNLADSFITTGVLGILVYYTKKERKPNKKLPGKELCFSFRD